MDNPKDNPKDSNTTNTPKEKSPAEAVFGALSDYLNGKKPVPPLEDSGAAPKNPKKNPYEEIPLPRGVKPNEPPAKIDTEEFYKNIKEALDKINRPGYEAMRNLFREYGFEVPDIEQPNPGTLPPPPGGSGMKK
jgi:hypothetical protein